MPKASKARRYSQGQTTPKPQAASLGAETAGRPRRRIQEMSNRTRVISLIVGDALCFIIFAVLGTDAHQKGSSFLYDLWVSLPFMAAWFLVSPFVGAYRADVATLPAKMLRRTLLAWLASWPVAMALRWLLIERTNPIPLASFLSFSLVTLLVNLVILVIWRWPFALNNSLRKRGI